MRKSLLLCILIFVCVLAVGFVWHNRTLEQVRIVAFGDSLTYGTGSKQGGGFVSVLEHDLGVSIENMGVPGNTSADGVARIDEVINTKPTITIVFFGGNDVRKGVPTLETARNLALIDAALKHVGSKVILLNLEVLSGIWGHSDLMSDSLHPNDAGYALMARHIEPELIKLLR